MDCDASLDCDRSFTNIDKGFVLILVDLVSKLYAALVNQISQLNPYVGYDYLLVPQLQDSLKFQA
jgi:hypothetical protein